MEQVRLQPVALVPEQGLGVAEAERIELSHSGLEPKSPAKEHAPLCLLVVMVPRVGFEPTHP